MKKILLATTLTLTLVVLSPSARGQTAVEAWAQRYHEADSDDNHPLAIAVDSSGNAITTGFSRDTNFFDLKHWVGKHRTHTSAGVGGKDFGLHGLPSPNPDGGEGAGTLCAFVSQAHF